MNDYGLFCEVYGKTLRNLVLEYIIISSGVDFAISDMLEEIEISKPKLYAIIYDLEEQGIVKKSRIVAGAQLYVFNEDHPKSKLLDKSLRECIKSEYQIEVKTKKVKK